MQNKLQIHSTWSGTLEDDKTVLYEIKSLDGTKPNTNPNTNPIQLFCAFSSTVP